MSPDDTRHATEAGFEQHLRDDEDPCAPCRHAKLVAGRRRHKRKVMGHRYTVPIGKLYDRLTNWRDAGASYGEIGDHLGIEESRVWEIVDAGPSQVVYTRTYNAIAAASDKTPITAIGITRRIRSLTWLGYSTQQIADASGAHVDTIVDIRANGREFVARKVRAGVVDAYDRLHMTLPTGETRQLKAGITRAQNIARNNGWLPPLAWTDIDDRRDDPTNWEYQPTHRADALRELDANYVGVSEACRRLHLSREALQKWCGNHGMSDLYRRLVTREQYRPNGSIGAA